MSDFTTMDSIVSGLAAADLGASGGASGALPAVQGTGEAGQITATAGASAPLEAAEGIGQAGPIGQQAKPPVIMWDAGDGMTMDQPRPKPGWASLDAAAGNGQAGELQARQVKEGRAVLPFASGRGKAATVTAKGAKGPTVADILAALEAVGW